ncbi:ESPR-type extended signal peptide-containing protein [Megasphaera sp.]|uniref:ESPR-type extended signal peptide-containing protein n=2 Tax=Megasphaera sp. TaxID=2023260 RepID=UPI003AAB21E0
MNKIYKVVWNTVRNCYVVGSELISSKSGRHSTSNGKSSSLKVTLTVLALCGMTALGIGVAPAYAADGTGAVTAKNQYVALKFSSPNDGDSRAKFSNGQWHTTFNGEKYDTVDSGMRDRDNQPILYWVREGYSLTMVDGQPYTSLSSNGRRADVSWTGDANAKPSDILESVTSTHVQTNVTTNVGETLQQVNAGTYAGVSNSGGTEVDGSWNYIVKDSSWKGIVRDSNYRNGYADLVSSGKPRGFVRTTDDGSKLAWNATLSAYTYNGKVVDYSNIYVIDGEIGVFTNASGSEVYTGTVFGKNNEVLMTVKKSDGSYYSYWGAEVNDAGATMDTYRVAEYQKDLNVLRDNDFALYHNDIKSVDMSTNDSSATISLMRNGDGTTSPAVDGTLTITNGGGTGGNDTYVRISNTTNGQEVSKTFTTGSKVSAIGSTDATTGLTINGIDYTIKAGKDYKAGANIQISADNTISATDTKYTAGANVSIDENNVISAVDTDTKYTAGKNITIDENNVISAKEYTAGTNVSIENNKISAKNTTLTNGPAEKSVDTTSGGVTYTIKDTDGNAVTLEDVASATTVNKLIDGAKVHYFSVNASANQGNYNNDGAGNLSIAIGADASATKAATAVGNKSTADERSAAFGYLSDAKGTRAVAIGAESSTNGTNSTAIGQNAKAGYYKSNDDQVQAESATAVGSQAEVYANYGTAVGESAKVLSESGTALGRGAQIWENSAQGVAVGRGASVGSNGHAAEYGIALGAYSQAEAENGIAIGYDAVVSQPNSVALGSQATTNPIVKTSSIEIPNTNTTYNVNGTNPVGTVSVGSATGLRTITNVAAGRVSEASTDAVNGSELYAVAKEAAKHTTITTEEGSRITVDSQPNSAGGTEYILDVDTSDLANYSLTNLSQKGTTVITNLAKGVERHIKPDTYAVDDNGTVTMTYVNGNGEPVKNMTATITGIAKSDLSNITKEGNNVINNIAKKAVKVVDGKNTTVREGTLNDGKTMTYAVDVDTSGKVEQNNTNIVTGDTVYNALKDVSWTAKVNGTAAKTVKKDGTLNFVNGDNIAITSNKNGDIKISTTGLASSGDLWTAQAGGKDVKAVNQKVNFVGSDHITVTGTDGQIKFEATGLADTDLTNISEGGKTVINNLAKEAVKVVKGTNTTVTEGLSEDGKTKTYAVNVDNAAIQAATDVTGENGISVTSAVENGVKKYTVSAKLSNNFAIDQATGNIDLAPSISVGKTNPVTINGNTGEITGLSNKTTTAANFADGSGRAATEEQLEEVNSKATAAKTTVTAGKNIAVNGTSDENGSAYTVALADDVSLGNNAIQLKGTDGSISAKSGGAQLAFNTSGLTVSQAKNGLTNKTRIDGATITVDGGAGNQTIINGSTAHIGSVLVNGGSGTATITGLTNKTTDYTGFANGSGRAATEEQLKEVAGQAGEAIETAGKGWNLTTNKGTATNIAPGGTVDFSSGNDNLVISNAGADLSFSLSDNLDLTKNDSKKGSVKVGENTILTDELLQVGKDVSLTASALRVGASSLTTDALMVGGRTYISSSGLNANGLVISNVKAGVLGTDAVNVDQLNSTINNSQVSIKAGKGISVDKTGNKYTINVNINGVSNDQGEIAISEKKDSTSTESGSESGSSGAKKFKVMDLMYRADANEVTEETTTETTTDPGTPLDIENKPKDIKFEADDNQAAEVVNGETIKIAGDGVNISTSSKLTGESTSELDTISVSLKPDIKVDSIEAKTEGGQINIKSKVNMNSQTITNLADGEIAKGSTDAVNGGQLYNTNQAVIANAENINSLSHSLNKLDSRINRVGAGAAALAALHPLDFDPDNKWDFAAGYGNYAGANAVAIGTYYRPNENTMFSIGGSFGGGENMINAGVSFKLGSGGSGITTSKTVMAKKIKEQDELLKAQDAKMKEQDEKIAKLEALVAQQGEMIQQALGKK